MGKSSPGEAVEVNCRCCFPMCSRWVDGQGEGMIIESMDTSVSNCDYMYN